jgi:hypothetical protein
MTVPLTRLIRSHVGIHESLPAQQLEGAIDHAHRATSILTCDTAEDPRRAVLHGVNLSLRGRRGDRPAYVLVAEGMRPHRPRGGSAHASTRSQRSKKPTTRAA